MGRYNYSDPIPSYAVTRGYREILTLHSPSAKTTIRKIRNYDPMGNAVRTCYTVADALSNYKNERISRRDAISIVEDAHDWLVTLEPLERMVVDLDGVQKFEQLDEALRSRVLHKDEEEDCGL